MHAYWRIAPSPAAQPWYTSRFPWYLGSSDRRDQAPFGSAQGAACALAGGLSRPL